MYGAGRFNFNRYSAALRIHGHEIRFEATEPKTNVPVESWQLNMIRIKP